MWTITHYNSTFSFTLDDNPWVFSTRSYMRGLRLGRTFSILDVRLLSSVNWKLIFPGFSVHLSPQNLVLCFLSSEGKVSKISGVLRIKIRALHTTNTTTIIIRNRIIAVRAPTIHPNFSSVRYKTWLSSISFVCNEYDYLVREENRSYMSKTGICIKWEHF